MTPSALTRRATKRFKTNTPSLSEATILPSGPGSIAGTVVYGSVVVALPALTGVSFVP